LKQDQSFQVQGIITKQLLYGYILLSVSNYDKMLPRSQLFDLDNVYVPFYSLLHEPFKSIPVIWTVHECALARRISEYNSSGLIRMIDAWKEAFSRANVIVFPNYILPVLTFSHSEVNGYTVLCFPSSLKVYIFLAGDVCCI
jgi:hypothetical protein